MRRKYLSNCMRRNDRRRLGSRALWGVNKSFLLLFQVSPYYWTHFRAGLSNSPQKKFRTLYLLRSFFFVRWNILETGASAISFLRPRLISQIVKQKKDAVIAPICHLQLATPPKKKKTNLHFSIFKTLLATFFCFFPERFYGVSSATTKRPDEYFFPQSFLFL